MNVDPLRQAVLAEARGEAAATRRRAQEERAARLAEARQQVVVRVSEARRAGQALGERESAQLQARARRQSTALVLGARREAVERLRHEALAAARLLPEEPGYGAFLERLAGEARDQLGAAASVEPDHEAGGLRAELASRSVDYTLPALVERCLTRLGERVAELWR